MSDMDKRIERALRWFGWLYMVAFWTVWAWALFTEGGTR